MCTNSAKATYQCTNQDRDYTSESSQLYGRGQNEQVLCNSALEKVVKMMNFILTLKVCLKLLCDATGGLHNALLSTDVGRVAQGKAHVQLFGKRSENSHFSRGASFSLARVTDQLS